MSQTKRMIKWAFQNKLIKTKMTLPSYCEKSESRKKILNHV